MKFRLLTFISICCFFPVSVFGEDSEGSKNSPIIGEDNTLVDHVKDDKSVIDHVSDRYQKKLEGGDFDPNPGIQEPEIPSLERELDISPPESDRPELDFPEPDHDEGSWWKFW